MSRGVSWAVRRRGRVETRGAAFFGVGTARCTTGRAATWTTAGVTARVTTGAEASTVWGFATLWTCRFGRTTGIAATGAGAVVAGSTIGALSSFPEPTR